MQFVVTMIFDLDEVFEGRKPDSEMIKRYLSSRIGKGLVKEDNFRGRVVMAINKVQQLILKID